MNSFLSFLKTILFLTVISSTTFFAQNNFNENIIDSSVYGLGSIYTCDLDGDSDIDILGAVLEESKIVWWRNDGGNPISWSKFTIANAVGEAHSVYAADIDGDNDLDVVGAAYTGVPGIAWWRNDGGDPITWTKFRIANNFINAHAVNGIDLDKDNDIDILGVSSSMNKVSWWRNDGGDPVIWTEQNVSSSVNLGKFVTAADIDNDNDYDLIGVSLALNQVLIWRNDGGSPIKWTQITVDNSFGGAHYVEAVDLDNDNDIDIIGAAYYDNEIAWWRNDGGDPIIWTKQTIENNFINACVVKSSDLDGDGDLDIVGTGQGINQIAYWENIGGTPVQWQKHILSNDFTRPWPLSISDLNKDGYPDIIVGSSHRGSNIISWWTNKNLTDIEQSNNIINNYNLEQNYPNPFNPTTVINYDLPEVSQVSLKIFDIMGREVKTLINENKTAGNYEVTFDGSNLSSGVYFYRLQAGNFVQTKKLVLMK